MLTLAGMVFSGLAMLNAYQTKNWDALLGWFCCLMLWISSYFQDKSNAILRKHIELIEKG